VTSSADYEAALKTVTDAAAAYRGGLVASGAATAASTPHAVSPWTPIYAELLADLKAALESAGEAYEHAADQLGLPKPERYDWRPETDNRSDPRS